MRADAPAGDEVDLDARFVQRAQHARLVGAGRPEPGSTSAVRSRSSIDGQEGGSESRPFSVQFRRGSSAA